MKDYVVTIPAYNPMDTLDQYIQHLITAGVSHVLVVNDGSDEHYTDLFQRINMLERTTVLTHQINQGKGAALKTACTYFQEQNWNDIGMVSADADGQHLLEDVLRVGEALLNEDAEYVLGVRNFSDPSVPKRSLLGNRLASTLFKWLYGYKIEDTQTGLRGWHRQELANLIALRGNRFEYEINMLIMIAKQHKSLHLVEIETVYHDNHTSHYSTIQDSVRIGWHMFKGIFSS